MKIWKRIVLFLLGGLAYVALELLWRGWSHGSMFVTGGICFLVLGEIGRRKLPLVIRGALGALVITGAELMAGLLVNRGYTVWDYRGQPANFLGQICLGFSLLWIPVSIGAMWLYTGAERLLSGRILRGLHRKASGSSG